MTKEELKRVLTETEAASQERPYEMAALKEKLEAQYREQSCLMDELKARLKDVCSCNDEMERRLQAATMPIRRDTYAAAVSTYGKHSQFIMAMEEMAELTKELSKNIRGEKNISGISEEIADVEIMLEQLKIIFGNRAEVDQHRSYKLERLAGRLMDEMA